MGRVDQLRDTHSRFAQVGRDRTYLPKIKVALEDTRRLFCMQIDTRIYEYEYVVLLGQAYFLNTLAATKVSQFAGKLSLVKNPGHFWPNF